MKAKKLTNRQRQSAAIRKMADVLCLVAPQHQICEVAAEGLAWRNRRLAWLERKVVLLKGDPWKGGPL